MTKLVIADVIQTVKQLPSLPAIVMLLMEKLEHEDVNIDALADSLSHDQALAAKTLRLANSSFYGLQSKVSTISQAISVLGFNQTRTLITAAAVTGAFHSDPDSLFDFQVFWRHAVATALCARALAKHVKANQGEAFIAGLLHDIGRIVLVTRFYSHYEQVLNYRKQMDCTLLEAERSVLETDHTAVGHALTVHWKFPLSVQDAVAGHHAPPAVPSVQPARLIHIANSVVQALNICGDDDEPVAPLAADCLSVNTFNAAVLHQVFRETEMQFEEACRILVP